MVVWVRGWGLSVAIPGMVSRRGMSVLRRTGRGITCLCLLLLKAHLNTFFLQLVAAFLPPCLKGNHLGGGCFVAVVTKVVCRNSPSGVSEEGDPMSHPRDA